MHSLLIALRFMHVVPPLPRLMHATCACVALIGTGAITLDPAAAPRTLAPILVLQLFAVSTGFAGYARRGYYDLLITGGVSRVTVAWAQWMMSALPGALVWLGLAVVEAITRWRAPDLLSPGPAAAMWMASTVPWACTVALPRFSAAIGVCIGGITIVTLGPPAAAALAGHTIAGAPTALRRVHDWLPLIASSPDAAIVWGAAAWMPALGATVAMLVALAWIRQSSFPLESGQ
jgi:hypothetical protein